MNLLNKKILKYHFLSCIYICIKFQKMFQSSDHEREREREREREMFFFLHFFAESVMPGHSQAITNICDVSILTLPVSKV